MVTHTLIITKKKKKFLKNSTINHCKCFSDNQLITSTLSHSISSIYLTTTINADQKECVDYELNEANRLYPKPNCTCPTGQMINDNMECYGQCLFYLNTTV